MTEQETQNLNIVQALFASFEAGDTAGALSNLAEDVAWRSPGPAAIPYAGLHSGREAVAAWFALVGVTVDYDDFAIDEWFASGERVIAFGHEIIRSRATGRATPNNFALLFTVQNGKITSFRSYEDTATLAGIYE